MKPWIQVSGASALGFIGVLVLSMPDSGASLFGTVPGDCKIKGNVSIGSGERIFHVPGQRYYAETRIDARFGERWFCSEADARAAGWRKAGQ